MSTYPLQPDKKNYMIDAINIAVKFSILRPYRHIQTSDFCKGHIQHRDSELFTYLKFTIEEVNVCG